VLRARARVTSTAVSKIASFSILEIPAVTVRFLQLCDDWRVIGAGASADRLYKQLARPNNRARGGGFPV
jgi:hypothetical protein